MVVPLFVRNHVHYLTLSISDETWHATTCLNMLKALGLFIVYDNDHGRFSMSMLSCRMHGLPADAMSKDIGHHVSLSCILLRHNSSPLIFTGITQSCNAKCS